MVNYGSLDYWNERYAENEAEVTTNVAFVKTYFFAGFLIIQLYKYIYYAGLYIVVYYITPLLSYIYSSHLTSNYFCFVIHYFSFGKGL